MGLLDPFRKRKPPTSPSGRSGRGHYAGFLELEELNTDLQGRQGLAIYDQMWREDGDVRRSLSMICNPLIAGTWTLEPFGGEDADEKAMKQMEFVKWVLFEFMRPNLKLHFAEAIPLFTRSGFAPFNTIWRSTEYEGRQVLVPYKLDVRLPRTIYKWEQDELGELTQITQFLTTNRREGDAQGWIDIPAEDLLYYRVGAEGDNWEGVSLLRPAYRHWYIKTKVEVLDAIAQEREATGIPIVYPPKGAGDDELDRVEEMLKRLKAGEEAWGIMPGPHADNVEPEEGGGWRLEILGLSGGGQGGGGTRDPSKMLSYHSDKIAAAVVAEFMRLGQAGEGARATADVQQDPFYAGVEALTNVVVAPWNDHLIPKIIAVNFPDAEGAPTLAMEKADSTALTELQTYVSGLAGSGALTVDEPLEDFLRDRADLPPADPEERAKQKQMREEKQQAELDAAKNPHPPERPGDKGEERTVETSEPHPDDGRRRIKKTTKETVRRFDGDGVQAFDYDPDQPRDAHGRWTRVEGGLTRVEDGVRKVQVRDINGEGIRKGDTVFTERMGDPYGDEWKVVGFRYYKPTPRSQEDIDFWRKLGSPDPGAENPARITIVGVGEDYDGVVREVELSPTSVQKNPRPRSFDALQLAVAPCPECGYEAAIEGVCPECMVETDDLSAEVFDYDPNEPRDDHGRWTSGPRKRPGTYYHEMLGKNVDVDIVSGPDSRGYFKVRLPEGEPFNGEVRRVKAMMVQEHKPGTFAQPEPDPAPRREKKRDKAKDPAFEKLHPRGAGGLFIEKGSEHEDAVKAIQKEVGAKDDGKFGPKTARAVRAYQRKHGLQVDGVVGRQTAMALLGHEARAKRAKVGALSKEQLRRLAHELGRG
jgi:hypothetical protein